MDIAVTQKINVNIVNANFNYGERKKNYSRVTDCRTKWFCWIYDCILNSFA